MAVGLLCRPPRYVFFLDPCNIDIVQRKIKSLALCVSLCPGEEMKTYEDLKTFAMLNGEPYPPLTLCDGSSTAWSVPCAPTEQRTEVRDTMDVRTGSKKHTSRWN